MHVSSVPNCEKPIVEPTRDNPRPDLPPHIRRRMKLSAIALLFVGISQLSTARPTTGSLSKDYELLKAMNEHLSPILEKRQQFTQGEPINAKGNGGPIAGRLILFITQRDPK